MSEKQISDEAGLPPQSGHANERSSALTWIGLAVIGLLLLAYLVWRPPPGGDQGTNHPAAGLPVVFRELEPLTGGGEAFTPADLHGKMTLVNLWGTWCGPCEQEFPYLVSIYDRFKSHRDFQYVSVSYPGEPLEIEDLRQATEEFLQRQRTSHATYYDPGGQLAIALTSIGVAEVFPTTLVVDGKGVVKAVWQGYSRASMSEIERLLEELLGE